MSSLQVVGVEDLDIKGYEIADMQPLLTAHIRAVRALHPAFATFTVVPIIERSPYIARSIAPLFVKVPGSKTETYHASHRTQREPGLDPTRPSQYKSIFILRGMLQWKRFKVAANFVSIGARAFNPKAYPESPEAVLTRLKIQLCNMRLDEKGHMTGKASGVNDDLASAFLLGLVGQEDFLNQVGLRRRAGYVPMSTHKRARLGHVTG